jgi:serine/threonine protein phosphatase PrpC
MCHSLDENGQQIIVEKSGSCATVILIVGEMCYSANVGDSRAVMSTHGGEHIIDLSDDHKPSEAKEYNRIVAANGNVY